MLAPDVHVHTDIDGGNGVCQGADGDEIDSQSGDLRQTLQGDAARGFDQGPAARALLRGLGYEAVTTRRDLEGRERVTSGRRPAGPAQS